MSIEIREMMNGNLINLLEALHQKINNYYQDSNLEHGFELFNSIKETWIKRPKFLILTLNPSAKKKSGEYINDIKPSPWPTINEYFNLENNFNIKRYVQGICYELSYYINEQNKFNDAYETARYFAENHCVIARFIPFRTENEKALNKNKSIYEFCSKEIWNEIFSAWQPNVILTLGKTVFNKCKKLFDTKYVNHDKDINIYQLENGLKYRSKIYEVGGSKIYLIGLAHPSWHGNVGLPLLPPKINSYAITPPGNTPCREFFSKIFSNSQIINW